MARKETKSASLKRKDSPSTEELDSKRPKTVEEQFEGKNPGNVIGGLKGTLKNPNASDEAKQHATEMLDAVDEDYEPNERTNKYGRDITHLMSGYRSTYERPETSESQRKKAQDTYGHLEQYHSRGGHLGHVIGGYKATLSNPNVSEEAKNNAREMLEELGAYENYDYKTKQDTEHLNTEGKDITHVMAGYKGTISNPNTSEEAKDHARKMLEQLEGEHKSGRHLGHVMAGYKGTLSNPNVSRQAKEHAQRVLKEMGADKYDYSYTRDERYNKHGEDLNRVIGGYKEAHARDSSEENKKHYKRALDTLEGEHKSGRHLGNVIGGYKATLSNPKTSDEAKDNARRMLEELGAEEYDYSHYQYKNADFRGKNYGNVMGGYKATLHNPNSSEEAKEHARQILSDNGVDEDTKASSNAHNGPADFSGKNTNNVLGGYKATLHNPNSSEEAKENARQVLADAGASEEPITQRNNGPADFTGKNTNNVLGGYKATLHNPNSSEEAKENARQVLSENGSSEEPIARKSNEGSADFSGKNPGNVMGGYKATLHNPNSSEEAKEHARQILSDNGVDESRKAY